VEGTRSYGDACAAAHGLDLIGERWALLVVRELLFGPKRFADLRAGLPNAGPNRISQRLRDLEHIGVIRRRRLGPPARAWVYELTEWGHGLEPVIIALGRWGRRSPWRNTDDHIGVDAIMVGLRSDFDPAAADGLTATYALHFPDDRFTVRVAEGRLTVSRGDPDRPDATLTLNAATFARLLSGRRTVTEAGDAGDLTLVGDPAAVERLFAAVAPARPASGPLEAS
jgi:DNA-binding HxlR family transcriptional regulator